MVEYALCTVSVAEWLRHLVVAQETVGSNPTTHPIPRGAPPLREGPLIIPRLSREGNTAMAKKKVEPATTVACFFNEWQSSIGWLSR